MRRWGPLLLLLAAPLLPLWRAVFLGLAIGPFDQIRQMAPWNGPKPSQPWDVLQADAVLQFYPWRDMVFSAWGKGQIPFWNPYEMAGAPLLGNSQSAGLYPLHILLGLLHLPTALAITFLAWFHLAWAGIGVYFLTKALGGRVHGALVAGLSFALCPFMIDWTGLASVITTVSWIPWVLAFVVRLLGERRRWDGLGLAGSVAMMLLGGHLQFSAYGLLAAVLVGLLTWAFQVERASVRRVGGIVVLAVAGVMLALPQLLPVLEFGRHSDRINTPSPAGYDAYVAGSIKPFEMANVLSPYALGSPREAMDIGVSQYWPALAKRGANLAESAVTLGPLVLIGLFLAPWKERSVWALGAVGGLALLLALGTALNYPLYFWIPGWSATGSPGRVICLFVLCASVLAGLGLSRVPDGPSVRKWLALAGGGLVLGLALTTLAPSLAPTDLVPADQLSPLASAATKAAFPLVISGCVLALVGFWLTFASKFRGLVVAVPVLICVFGYGADMLMAGAPLDPLPGADPNVRYAFQNEVWSLVKAAPAIAPANVAALSRVHELGGYDSIRDRDFVVMLSGAEETDPAPDANGNMMFIKPRTSVSALADAGVTALWTKEGIQPVAGPGRFVLTGGTVKVVDEGFDRLSLDVQGSGTLEVKDRMMEGWSATVDGQAVALPLDRWRTVVLPPGGSHRVEFRYVAPGFKEGCLAFLVALLGLAVYGARFAQVSKEPASDVKD